MIDNDGDEPKLVPPAPPGEQTLASITPSEMDPERATLPASGRPRRGRRLFFVTALLAGVSLGVAVAAWAGWAWAKAYVESPKFWTDLSASSGLELTAATTGIQLLPPTFSATNLEAKSEGVKLVSARRIEASLSLAKLIGLVADVQVSVAGLHIQGRTEAPAKKAGKPAAVSDGRIAWPNLPLRRVDLTLELSDMKTPIPYLPSGDVSLKLQAAVNAQGVQAQLESFNAFGLRATGTAQVGPDGKTRFELELPEKESLVSGKISGATGPKLSLKTELKLPNTPIVVPKGVQWLAGGKPVELSGSVNLGGGVKLSLEGERWEADAAWDLNLTAAAIQYGTFAKAVGKTATARGKFSGGAESWKLSDLALQFGQAKASLSVDSAEGAAMHVVGAVEPFEIAEFLPLFLNDSPKVSGKAEASVDVRLPKAPGAAAEPSGTVNVVLDGWVLDGASIVQLLAPPPPETKPSKKGKVVKKAAAIQPVDPDALEASGKFSLKGKIAANLDRGTFKDGSVRLEADATALGIRKGELYQKQAGKPLLFDLVGEGSGKQLAIRALRVRGPKGLRIGLKGAITDLKDYAARLQFAESRLPLDVVAEFVPRVGSASGLVELSGEVQGSLKNFQGLFAKLTWELRNVAFLHEAFSVKRLGGRIETIVSEGKKGAGDEDGDSESSEGTKPSETSYLVRLSGVSGQWSTSVAQGEEVPPVTVTAQGSVSYQSRALGGELNATATALDLRPWLKKSEPPAGSAAIPGDAGADAEAAPAGAAGLLDWSKSKFRLVLGAPLIRTPYLDFADAKATLAVGGDPELTIERISGRALEGDLSVKAKIKLPTAPKTNPRVELSASGQNLSMAESWRLIQRVSGKNLEQSVFGKGDIEVKGSVDGGLATADFQGKAEIREGGFKFLPVPKKMLDQLRGIPKVGDRMPGDRETGMVTDTLEKAIAKFHLKGERMDLEVQSLDSFMGMESKGHVTLSGHCDLSGRAIPSQKIVGAQVTQALPDGIPFTTTGDAWACFPKLDFGDLAQKLVKAQLNEHKDEARKVIQNSLKGLFGK